MLEKGMEETFNSILCLPLLLICELVWVQVCADNWENGIQHQFLQALCNYGGECYWMVVIEFCWARFFRNWDDDGCLPQNWHVRQDGFREEREEHWG